MSAAKFDLLDRLMDAYNAQDADAYAAFFTDDGAEASYRGAVLRDGKQGVRDGNAKTFAEFPDNRAEVLNRTAFGDRVAVHEKVWRTIDGESFEVLAIYSFEGEKISRVEFVR